MHRDQYKKKKTISLGANQVLSLSMSNSRAALYQQTWLFFSFFSKLTQHLSQSEQ